MSLCLGIMGGCQTTPKITRAAECEKPSLRGDTWADVAILSVEQASAIDICNIRNGVDTYQAVAPRAIPVPTQQECLWYGVAVHLGTPVTGRIRNATTVEYGKARLYCRESTIGHVVGCTNHVRGQTYDIFFEDEAWIRNHEACHAYYEVGGHTMDYLTTRD
jgi:hypothetical protein